MCDCAYKHHHHIIGCNPHQLSDDTPLPTGVGCGAPMHSLGISNGIVCYSGIDTGAVAVYSCFSCASGIIERSPSFRTCLPNGSWNGIIPRCECGRTSMYLDLCQCTLCRFNRSAVRILTLIFIHICMLLVPVIICCTYSTLQFQHLIQLLLLFYYC